MTVLVSLALCLLVPAIQSTAPRAPLVAREDWRETPASSRLDWIEIYGVPARR